MMYHINNFFGSFMGQFVFVFVFVYIYIYFFFLEKEAIYINYYFLKKMVGAVALSHLP
jgi:hypothetical protein